MKIVSASKITINFECVECKTMAKCGIHEAMENGEPICDSCHDMMEIVDCEIDTLED